MTQPNTSQTQDKEKKIRFYEITMEPALQSRVVMSPKKVADYQTALNNGAVFPPVLVAMQTNERGESRYRLLDGWHRMKAIENNGVSISTKVAAIIIEVPLDTTVHQLRYLGGQANIKNGLGLTPKDKRELFKSYVRGKYNREGKSYKSYRKIASDLSLVPHQTIARWMKSDFPAIANIMGKEFDDDYEGQPSAQGTGKSIVDMPDLSSRERDIFALNIIAEAKNSDNDARGRLIEWAYSLVRDLETEAPFSPKQLASAPYDSDDPDDSPF